MQKLLNVTFFGWGSPGINIIKSESTSVQVKYRLIGVHVLKTILMTPNTYR